MNAKELRIGNIIQSTEFKNPFSVDYQNIGFVMLEPDKYEPVKLTQEWLERFGFEDLYYGKDKFGWIKDGVNISKYFNFVLMLPNGEYFDSTKIKHVHQLQNLYFALTGDELV